MSTGLLAWAGSRYCATCFEYANAAAEAAALRAAARLAARASRVRSMQRGSATAARRDNYTTTTTSMSVKPAAATGFAVSFMARFSHRYHEVAAQKH